MESEIRNRVFDIGHGGEQFRPKPVDIIHQDVVFDNARRNTQTQSRKKQFAKHKTQQAGGHSDQKDF